MTISPRKKEQLTDFLSSLSGATALKLFTALEADRAKGGGGLPHNELLSSLRAQLLAKGAPLPPRKTDAKRLFFTPFEDFFIAAHPEKKQFAQIARTSLEPIWRLMMTHPALSDAALAAASLDEALARGGDKESLARALFIAAEAGIGRLCDEADAAAAAQARLAESLGSENAVADLMELRRMLTGISFFNALRGKVPSSAPSLNESQLYEIRSLFLSAHEQSQTLGSYVLLALKGRLEKPWRALGVYYHLAGSADERIAAAKEAAAMLPESLFNDVETLARAFEREGTGELDARAALLRVTYFADYADGLAHQAAKIGDNVYLNRVEACRDVAAEAFERFGELALAALRDAMPLRQAGGSTRLMAQRPDIAAPLSTGAVERAADAARLIARSPVLAKRLGAEASFAAAIAEDAREKVHIYAKDLVAEIRAAEGDERNAARRLLNHILTIAGPLLKSDEIGLIRDRAAAAAVAV